MTKFSTDYSGQIVTVGGRINVAVRNEHLGTLRGVLKWAQLRHDVEDAGTGLTNIWFDPAVEGEDVKGALLRYHELSQPEA